MPAGAQRDTYSVLLEHPGSWFSCTTGARTLIVAGWVRGVMRHGLCPSLLPLFVCRRCRPQTDQPLPEPLH